MHVIRFEDTAGTVGVGIRTDDGVRRLQVGSVAELLSGDLAHFRESTAATGESVDVTRSLPPVDGRTEVWAAGVTYLRSRDARIEESTQASVYDLVYGSERPELFLKSAAWRVVTDGDPLCLRADSAMDVPEPELAALVCANGEIAGWTVCDDLTSRSIEGENPLYLPQAKIWDGSCSLAAGIRPAWEVDATDLRISLTVTHGADTTFEASTSTAQLHRTVDDLVQWLVRETSFPDGVVLSTGTGIVPPLDFTLHDGDVVRIDIAGVGSLNNPLIRR